MRPVALSLLSSLLLVAWPSDSDAQTAGVPVYVSVQGSGKIKVRIAAGVSAPCDASSNLPLFDGELRAGDKIELRSPGWSACVQHTFGAFRQVGWSTPVIVGPRCLRWGGRRCASSEGFLRVELSTSAAFVPR
jgi:hypothetical protein